MWFLCSCLLQEQYVLIYDIILNWVLYGDVEMSVGDFFHPLREHGSYRMWREEQGEGGKDGGEKEEEETKGGGRVRENEEEDRKEGEDKDVRVGGRMSAAAGLERMLKVSHVLQYQLISVLLSECC